MSSPNPQRADRHDDGHVAGGNVVDGRWSPRLPNDWWLRHPAYLRYMLREASCIPIGAYAVLLIVALHRLGQGPEAWQGFRTALASGPGVALQLLALAFAAWHSITWFALAPRTMPLQVGARRVPSAWIAAAHYVAWAAVTVLVLLIVGS